MATAQKVVPPPPPGFVSKPNVVAPPPPPAGFEPASAIVSQTPTEYPAAEGDQTTTAAPQMSVADQAAARLKARGVKIRRGKDGRVAAITPPPDTSDPLGDFAERFVGTTPLGPIIRDAQTSANDLVPLFADKDDKGNPIKPTPGTPDPSTDPFLMKYFANRGWNTIKDAVVGYGQHLESNRQRALDALHDKDYPEAFRVAVNNSMPVVGSIADTIANEGGVSAGTAGMLTGLVAQTALGGGKESGGEAPVIKPPTFNERATGLARFLEEKTGLPARTFTKYRAQQLQIALDDYHKDMEVFRTKAAQIVEENERARQAADQINAANLNNFDAELASVKRGLKQRAQVRDAAADEILRQQQEQYIDQHEKVADLVWDKADNLEPPPGTRIGERQGNPAEDRQVSQDVLNRMSVDDAIREARKKKINNDFASAYVRGDISKSDATDGMNFIAQYASEPKVKFLGAGIEGVAIDIGNGLVANMRLTDNGWNGTPAFKGRGPSFFVAPRMNPVVASYEAGNMRIDIAPKLLVGPEHVTQADVDAIRREVGRHGWIFGDDHLWNVGKDPQTGEVLVLDSGAMRPMSGSAAEQARAEWLAEHGRAQQATIQKLGLGPDEATIEFNRNIQSGKASAQRVFGEVDRQMAGRPTGVYLDNFKIAVDGVLKRALASKFGELTDKDLFAIRQLQAFKDMDNTASYQSAAGGLTKLLELQRAMDESTIFQNRGYAEAAELSKGLRTDIDHALENAEANGYLDPGMVKSLHVAKEQWYNFHQPGAQKAMKWINEGKPIHQLIMSDSFTPQNMAELQKVLSPSLWQNVRELATKDVLDSYIKQDVLQVLSPRKLNDPVPAGNVPKPFQRFDAERFLNDAKGRMRLRKIVGDPGFVDALADIAKESLSTIQEPQRPYVPPVGKPVVVRPGREFNRVGPEDVPVAYPAKVVPELEPELTKADEPKEPKAYHPDQNAVGAAGHLLKAATGPWGATYAIATLVGIHHLPFLGTTLGMGGAVTGTVAISTMALAKVLTTESGCQAATAFLRALHSNNIPRAAAALSTVALARHQFEQQIRKQNGADDRSIGDKVSGVGAGAGMLAPPPSGQNGQGAGPTIAPPPQPQTVIPGVDDWILRRPPG